MKFLKIGYKYSILTVLFTACSILLGFLVLNLNGFAIQSIVDGNTSVKRIAMIIAVYSVLQIFISLTNAVYNGIMKYFLVSVFEKAWTALGPSKIKAYNRENSERFYNTVYVNIPKLVSFKISNLAAVSSAVVIGIIFLYQTIHDDFWIGLAYVPVLMLLSFVSNKAFKKRYMESIDRVSSARVDLMKWINSFFSGYKGVFFNWGRGLFTEEFENWYKDRGFRCSAELRSQAKIGLLRNIIGSMGSEWPYIICISVTMIMAAIGKFSVAKLVVWLGLTSYLVNANNSFHSFLAGRVSIKGLSDTLKKDLDVLMRKDEKKDELSSGVEYSDKTYDFELLDGNRVSISLEPRLYQVKGSNGCGKTTLINTIIGTNDDYKYWNKDKIESLRRQHGNKVRVIEKNIFIDDSVNDFSFHILGFNKNGKKWEDVLNKVIKNVVPAALADLWIDRLKQLENEWKHRKDRTFSSGEKIILSTARMLSTFSNDVKLVAADECESFLDKKTRKLFMDTLRYLSKNTAVVFVSHTNNIDAKLRNKPFSIVVSGYMLATNPLGKGFIIPMYVSAVNSGGGRIKGVGNIGKNMTDVLEMAIKAVVNTWPNSSFIENFDFTVECDKPGYVVNHNRSAGLALSVAVMNILRACAGNEGVYNVAATGRIRIDGSVLPVTDIDLKTKAALEYDENILVITPHDVSHLKDVYDILYSNHIKPSKVYEDDKRQTAAG